MRNFGISFVLLLVSGCVYSPYRHELYWVTEYSPSDLFLIDVRDYKQEGVLFLVSATPTKFGPNVSKAPYELVVTFIDHTEKVESVNICNLSIYGRIESSIQPVNTTDCLSANFADSGGRTVSIVLTTALTPAFDLREEFDVQFDYRLKSDIVLEPIKVTLRFSPRLVKGLFQLLVQV